MMYKTLILAALLTGCATSPRLVTDAGDANKPDWVSSTKVSWTKGDDVFVRSQYTIRGDERLNGCYQLVKLDAKETLIREIQEDIKGRIDVAQEGLAESAELAMTQVRTSEFSGKVVGMRMVEQYHERYVANGVERIDCFVLGSIRRTDYDSLKRRILDKVAETSPAIKQAIRDRAVEFFATDRKPASQE